MLSSYLNRYDKEWTDLTVFFPYLDQLIEINTVINLNKN